MLDPTEQERVRTQAVSDQMWATLETREREITELAARLESGETCLDTRDLALLQMCARAVIGTTMMNRAERNLFLQG